MLRKKVISLILVTSLISSLLVGCGGSNTTSSNTSSGKVTITFWHTFSDTEKVVFNKQIVPEFEKEYPNIKIKSVTMPTNGLKQQVVQAVNSSSGPDVMRMDIIWVPEFANMGSLKEVDNMDGFKTIKDGSFEAPLNTTKWKDKYYGVPQDTNTKVAIYSKALLKEAGLNEAPKTMDDLISSAEKLKGKYKSGLLGISGTEAWAMSPWFLSLGGKYCDDKYTKADGYINSDDSVAALEKIVKLNDEGVIGKVMLGGQPGTWDGIKKSQYLMIDDGPWFYSILKDEAKQKAEPALIPEGKGGSVSVVGGEDLVMFQNTKHEKESWEFMKFMSSKKVQVELEQKANLMPTNKEAANDSKVTSDPIEKLYLQQMKTAWARIPNPKFEEMNDKIQKTFEAAIRHKGTTKDLLNQLAKDMDALFAQSKSK